MRIILASNSPRRKQLLAKLVSGFEIIPSLSPEQCSETNPALYATQLACHKANDVWQCVGADTTNTVVIGCDTVVDLDGKILGKPHDAAEAKKMLLALSGKTHFVHTGACLIYCGEQVAFCDTTSVTFRKLTDAEIDQYVQSGAPMDKAGAYGIQECGFVESYCGSYDNVMGFPTEKMAEALEKYKR